MKNDIKNLKILSDRRFLSKSINTINKNDINKNDINKNDNSQYVIKNSLYIKNNMILFVLFFLYIF